MAQSRADRVARAIEDLRAFHAVGRGSVRRRSARGAYGAEAAEEEARQHGLNVDTLRKARQFADPAGGYTEAELDSLCRHLKGRQAELAKQCRLLSAREVRAEERRPVFGRTHLIRLLTVTGKRRAALQRRAVEGCWSTARLEAEVARRFGPRRQGGRRPYVAEDLEGVYTQLEAMCEHWRRWYAELAGDAAEAARGVVAAGGLPDGVARRLREASAALLEVQKAAAAELRAVRPSRQGRQSLTAEAAHDRGAVSRKRARGRRGTQRE